MDGERVRHRDVADLTDHRDETWGAWLGHIDDGKAAGLLLEGQEREIVPQLHAVGARELRSDDGADLTEARRVRDVEDAETTGIVPERGVEPVGVLWAHLRDHLPVGRAR